MVKKIKQSENYLRVFNNIWNIKDLKPHAILVLSLLVSYDELNEKDITLTSKAIAKHFNFIIAKKTVDAILPKLEELGYITKRMEDVWSEYLNRYESKRLIEITPKTYAIINGELSVEELSKPNETVVLKPTEASAEPEAKPNSFTIDNGVDGSDTLQFGQIEVVEEIPDVVITEEKLKWLNKKSNSDLSIDDLKELGQDVVNTLCYNDSGIWIIDNANSENRFLIRLYYQGGSLCKLINCNNDNDLIRINYPDLLYLLDKKDIDFSQLTPKLYNHIKNNGLEKRPLNNNESGTAA